jgi:hypothetical protein|tara:strand:+ start:7601 stop:8725 length:1125 start_codon:yes stop_codon:yes gene_type:complete
MDKKRLSIIGRGTVGCLTALNFSNKGYDIDWYHDPNTPALSVGEGTDLSIPKFLQKQMGFNHDDFIKLDGHYKLGIEKINWGKNPFTHWFPPSNLSWHINANKLQNHIIDRIGDKVNIIEKKIEHKDIENIRYIIDCSGKPSDINELTFTPIPVNKAYVMQCPWERPRFDKTICIAKSYGWVFLIPLQNRCSVGYIFNNHFSTILDLSTDIEDILTEYNLEPNPELTRNMSFSNYYRKNNFQKNVSYNGNASSFLEPLEATSLGTSIRVIDKITNILESNDCLEMSNHLHELFLKETIDIIMLHYLIDPPIKNGFWEHANHKANTWFSKRYKDYPKIRLITKSSSLHYGTWYEESFKQNIKGLNILDKLNNFKW